MHCLQVNTLGKTKGSLEELEPVAAWDPPPCYVSHFSKLREGYAAAKVSWAYHPDAQRHDLNSCSQACKVEQQALAISAYILGGA